MVDIDSSGGGDPIIEVAEGNLGKICFEASSRSLFDEKRIDHVARGQEEASFQADTHPQRSVLISRVPVNAK
jgi:hypothetical protein